MKWIRKTKDNLPLIVIPDTHGHLCQVETLVCYFRRHGYLKDHRLAFLGDYVDRGPQVRELIDFCIALQKEGHVFLAGNHDYTLEMVLSEHGARKKWIDRWRDKYEEGTLKSYGLRKPRQRSLPEWIEAADELKASLPKAHLKFITSLPFLHETDTLILVHAGLEESDWPAQRMKLLSRDKSEERGPAQLFSQQLAKTIDHPAPKTVVSGHAINAFRPIVGPRRVLLHCGVEIGGPLVAWISNRNKFIQVT